jgi:2-amino-4-hydroxy-6-hydroxymethyldihydropteridine diphosphokinase
MTKKQRLHTAYLGLGTNLGDKEGNIRRACELIAERIGRIERQSDLYRSEPWGFQSENDFVNAAICVKTPMKPQELLTATQEIERAMGRTEKSTPTAETSEDTLPVYHDRTIDIDILLYDDLHIDEPDLKIPHPLMLRRDFVMIPLNQIMAGTINS